MSENNGEDNLPVHSGDLVMSKQEIAYLMKRQGLSLSDIAQELNTPVSVISQYIKNQLQHDAEALSDEERQSLLALENARYEYYLSKIWPQIEYGDLKAVQTALAISDRKIRANQLDLPSSTSTTQVLVIGGESVSYIEKLKGMVGDA